MKKLTFMAVILFICLSFNFADAQIRFSVGVNINNQPDWGPVGYDHADYYYMPDIETFYDVPNHSFIYYSNHTWRHSAELPYQYRNYDIYHGYKVVVNEQNPWAHGSDFRARYARYRGRHDQMIIRDSHDERYRNHWHEDHGHGNDHGDRGHHNGNNHGDRGNHNGDDQGDRGHGHDRG